MCAHRHHGHRDQRPLIFTNRVRSPVHECDAGTEQDQDAEFQGQDQREDDQRQHKESTNGEVGRGRQDGVKS